MLQSATMLGVIFWWHSMQTLEEGRGPDQRRVGQRRDQAPDRRYAILQRISSFMMHACSGVQLFRSTALELARPGRPLRMNKALACASSGVNTPFDLRSNYLAIPLRYTERPGFSPGLSCHILH